MEYTEHMSDACDAAEVVCAAGGVEALTRAIMRNRTMQPSQPMEQLRSAFSCQSVWGACHCAA